MIILIRKMYFICHIIYLDTADIHITVFTKCLLIIMINPLVTPNIKKYVFLILNLAELSAGNA